MKPQLSKLQDRNAPDPSAERGGLVAAEDPHFGTGESADDDGLTEEARRHRADLWDRIADSFA